MKNKVERQKKDIEYLLEIEKRYQILVENANDAICFISPEGKYLFYNSKFLEMFGYTDAEMEDKTFYDIVHPDDRSLVKKRRKARLLGGDVPKKYEYRAVTKDGKTLCVETNATLVKREDEVLGIQTILRDVTERKKVEKKLRESEERYRNLVEFCPEMIAIHDRQKILYINPTGAKLLGAEGPEEVINRPILNFVHPDYRGVIATQFQQVQGEEKHKSFTEGTLVRVDGQVIHYEVHSTPVTYLDNPARQIILRDITDRKKIEDEFRQSETRLKNAHQVAHIGNWEWNLKTNDLYWSDENYRIFGLSKDVVPSYEAFEKTIHPEDLEFVNKSIEDVLQRKKPYNIDFRTIRPDGEERIVHAMGKVDYDEAGAPLRFFGTIQDITERKRAEESLKKSEEKYRSLFFNMTNAFAYHKMIFDEKNQPIDYVFLEVNDAFEKNTGLKREDIIGKKVTEVIQGIENTEPDLISVYGGVAKTGEGTNFELYFEPFNRWYSISAYCPQKGYFVTVFDEITERKKAEDEIRNLKEFNENIVQSMMEGIMIEDEKGIIMFVNPRTEELLGYSKGELIGRNWKEISVSEYIEKMEEETAKRPKGISSSYEAVVLSKTREEIPIIISATPIFEDGAFKGVLSVFRDIRERKLLEQQHIDARNEAEFYIDLMRHDINNDNTVAQGLLSLILEDSSELGEAQSKLIAMALKAVRRSSNLIDSVRTLQIAKATGEEVFKKTDLSAALDNAINEVKALHNDKEILINYKPKEAYIYTDNLVRDLFVNLLDNAAKYDLSDKVTIDIEIEDVGDSWRIGIKDHGSGIPDDLKEVIFIRFQRIDKGMRGSGIGLYLVKTLIDKYNGNIYVESRVKGDHSKGSIFYVTLPKG